MMQSMETTSLVSPGHPGLPLTASSKTEARFPENLPEGWRAKLAGEQDAPYFESLTGFLRSEYRAGVEVYPSRQNVLRALTSVDFDDVRVVILGQDPYHGPGQATGFSFAVPNRLKPKPPSLQNIFKEIQSDLGSRVDPMQSELSGWASQGVLLLNTVLTVRRSAPLSHRGKGWETFTDKVIRSLGERERPVIFILWGSPARQKRTLITGAQHFILESAHPSPLSAHRGFMGSRPFSQVNAILEKLGEPIIDWVTTG